MKTIFKIASFAIVLFLIQACGSKSNENTNSETVELTAEEKLVQEKAKEAHRKDSIRQVRLKMAADRRAAAEASYKDDKGEVIYNKPEVAPAFPGGQDALMKYFNDNLKYPAEAEAKGWEGTVYVDFVIGKDGKVRASTITDETDEDVDASFKAEALRVVDSMPKWTPGKQVGKPVSVQFNLPIAFKISA